MAVVLDELIGDLSGFSKIQLWLIELFLFRTSWRRVFKSSLLFASEIYNSSK